MGPTLAYRFFLVIYINLYSTRWDEADHCYLLTRYYELWTCIRFKRNSQLIFIARDELYSCIVVERRTELGLSWGQCAHVTGTWNIDSLGVYSLRITFVNSPIDEHKCIDVLVYSHWSEDVIGDTRSHSGDDAFNQLITILKSMFVLVSYAVANSDDENFNNDICIWNYANGRYSQCE